MSRGHLHQVSTGRVMRLQDPDAQLECALGLATAPLPRTIVISEKLSHSPWEGFSFKFGFVGWPFFHTGVIAGMVLVRPVTDGHRTQLKINNWKYATGHW